MPSHPLCCGYALLSSGAVSLFRENMERNKKALAAIIEKARQAGFKVERVAAACGSCQDGLERHKLSELGISEQIDVTRYVTARIPKMQLPPVQGQVLYHAPCHVEVPGENKVKGAAAQAKTLANFTGIKINVSPGCCGESGMGAISSPTVYNALRVRKHGHLAEILPTYPQDTPIVVGCPSCKQGLARILLDMNAKRKVMHSVEWLASLVFTSLWGDGWWRVLRRNTQKSANERGIRVVDVGRETAKTVE
jgi:Fe-S oxidoreductase